METLHNQELVATILEDNVASELTTIQDFLRWTYSTFNRSDIYYGQGHDNAWDESLQLVLAGLQLPLDLPQDLFNSKLTHSEKETLVQLVLRYQCLEKCNPKEVPYCITQALIHAVKGELEQGLIFCGENVSRIHEMTTVPELMRELTQG